MIERAARQSHERNVRIPPASNIESARWRIEYAVRQCKSLHVKVDAPQRLKALASRFVYAQVREVMLELKYSLIESRIIPRIVAEPPSAPA